MSTDYLSALGNRKKRPKVQELRWRAGAKMAVRLGAKMEAGAKMEDRQSSKVKYRLESKMEAGARVEGWS